MAAEPPAEHRFKRGRSGNPGGRPTSGLAALRKDIQAQTSDGQLLVEQLVQIVRGEAEKGQRKPTVGDRVKAASVLLAYGWGPPLNDPQDESASDSWPQIIIMQDDASGEHAPPQAEAE